MYQSQVLKSLKSVFENYAPQPQNSFSGLHSDEILKLVGLPSYRIVISHSETSYIFKSVSVAPSTLLFFYTDGITA